LLILLTGIAGSVGAVLRYLTDKFISDKIYGEFPLGTFIINASGSFLLGFIVGLGSAHHLSSFYSTVLGTGFCGAFTTFSTYMYETYNLIMSKSYLQATLNLLGTTAICITFAAVGLYLK
jgi:CrcB protein